MKKVVENQLLSQNWESQNHIMALYYVYDSVIVKWQKALDSGFLEN